MLVALRITGELLKLRIGLAVALAALAGMLAAEGRFSTAHAAAFLLAVLGASGAAGAFNHYWERESDRAMRRTCIRPFASGRLRPGAVWPVTFAFLLAASLVLAWAAGGAQAAVWLFLGAFTYGVVYTVWLKRQSAWNIVIGGAAGSFAILAGAAAVGEAWAPAPLILALVMFLWTPPHFWSLAAARGDDYRRTGVPMLPVLVGERVWATAILGHAIVLVTLSLVPLAVGLGWVYGAFALAGGGWFLWRSLQLWAAPSRQAALANFRASLMQFSLLVCGVYLDAAVRWGA